MHAPPGVGGESSPLTYQVFTPDTVPPPRSMQPSRVSFPDATPRSSLRLRIGLAAVAVGVVLATTLLIIVGAADDPPHAASASAKSASVAAGPTSSPSAAPPVVSAALLADPPLVVAAVTAEPIADPTPPPAKPAKGAKGAKAASAASAAPALRGVALPPNPFGASGGAAKPAAKKK